MTGLQIYTGTYQRFEPSMGVPVRSTVGLPRFSLSYQIAGHWVSVTPQATAQMSGAEAPRARNCDQPKPCAYLLILAR